MNVSLTPNTEVRTIEHYANGDKRIALVPLGLNGEKGHAVVLQADLEMMENLGLSLRWNRHHETGAVFAPAYKASGNNVQVARVLLDLGPGEQVIYDNGDPTDLRRDNLLVTSGPAIRRDRDFLTPADRRQHLGQKICHIFVTPSAEEEVAYC